MSGRPNKKMFETMVKKHGSEEAARDWFRSIGGKGGKRSRGGGFSTNIPCSCSIFHYDHFIANCAGKKGGKISKRTKNV